MDGVVYILRLCHLPTLSETISLENHRGEEFIPANGNIKQFLREVIENLQLNVDLYTTTGSEKTTTALGRDIMRAL